MTATALAPPATASERRFYTGMALAMLVTVFVGFAPTFFLRPFYPEVPAPPERVFLLHGVLFSAWIALLVVQTSLVSARRVAWHRAVGPWGTALAAAMVVVGTYSALVAAARPQGFINIPVPPLAFLSVPFADMVLFPAFVVLAVAHRREPQTHKRLMLLATVALLGAAVARWPVLADFGPLAFFGVTDLFIVALGVWDFRTRGRLHPATLWGGLALIASQPVRLALGETQAWLAFARWAVGLVS